MSDELRDFILVQLLQGQALLLSNVLTKYLDPSDRIALARWGDGTMKLLERVAAEQGSPR